MAAPVTDGRGAPRRLRHLTAARRRPDGSARRQRSASGTGSSHWPGGPRRCCWPRSAWLAVYRLNGPLWDTVVYDLAGLDPSSRLGSGLHFFCYDTVKIALLLTGIIFVVTVLRSYITLERTRALLGGRRQGVGNVAAAGLGVVTPFCSCSAVPAFIGFVAAGVPIGVTLSFLIASPLVNEVAVVLLYGLFGFKIAALYVTSGLLIAITAGFALGRLHVERWVEPFVFQTTLHGRQVAPGQPLTWSDRMALGREEVKTILRKIWPTCSSGSASARSSTAGPPKTSSPATPTRTTRSPPSWPSAWGVPLYSNAAGVLPLVQALQAKGLAMGTVLGVHDEHRRRCRYPR